MKCRFCNNSLKHIFASLGMTPLSNSYLTEQQLCKMEPYYPLDVYICSKCFLAQLDEYEAPENIFSDYAYFSSYSNSWQHHTATYVEKVISRFQLNKNSYVIEIASNDGCLLKNFIRNNIHVLGIEPAENVANTAKQNGVPTKVAFFGINLAKKIIMEDGHADLLIGNNVLAHVPDINDFVDGIKILLSSNGVVTMEFPHLMNLIEKVQFDTIYHEHFSYLSFLTVEKIFKFHGLTIFDVEEISTHGGSLRIYACHSSDTSKEITKNVAILLKKEKACGYDCLDIYSSFNDKIKAAKINILEFLISVKKAGKDIIGYGAPAKGNTLLNYCGISTDFIDYTVDKNQYKQGKYLPGSRIPIFHPDKIKETKPHYIFILPWNLKDEIMNQLSFIKEWGGKFVTPIPKIDII